MSIRTETADGVLTLTFDRLDRKNAITAAMDQTLADALVAAETDPAIRVIVLAGHESIFTAGNDLEDFMKNPPAGMDAPVFQFMMALGLAEKPVLVAVNGAAVGIGTTLLAHADFAYCADNAMFSMPFVSLGLCAEFGSSLLVPLAAGYHKAAEKLLLGEPMSAEEALEMKLVNRILPPGEVLEHTLRQARRFNALPPASVRETKRLMKAGWRSLTEKIIADEAQTFAHLLKSAEAKEAFNAFFERRKPDFSRFQ